MTIARQTLNYIFIATLIAALAYSVFTVGNAADLADLPKSAEETSPLRSGDRARPFTVRTVDGEDYRFNPSALERPTVLISFRGGWCPYCNMHLSELRTVIPGIRDMGVDVLFLSNDRPDQLYSGLARETRQDISGLDYLILSDARLEAARAMGTAFKTKKGLHDYLDGKGRDYEDSSIDRFSALGVPFVYLVDISGMIVFDFVQPDYKVRISASELQAAAQHAVD